MKVVIGPYRNWIGPYQIADAIFFWQDKYSATCKWASRAHKLGDWLALDKNGDPSYLARFCEWVHSKKKRKVDIRLDKYDSWGADTTIALITLPILKQLKTTKHGSGFIEDVDVPEHLRSTSAPFKEDTNDHDDNFHKRYEWFLNEVIWVLSCVASDDDTDKYYDHGVPVKGESLMESIGRIKVDREGLEAHIARKQHALMMFGKYFETLWD